MRLGWPVSPAQELEEDHWASSPLLKAGGAAGGRWEVPGCVHSLPRIPCGSLCFPPSLAKNVTDLQPGQDQPFSQHRMASSPVPLQGAGFSGK